MTIPPEAINAAGQTGTEMIKEAGKHGELSWQLFVILFGMLLFLASVLFLLYKNLCWNREDKKELTDTLRGHGDKLDKQTQLLQVLVAYKSAQTGKPVEEVIEQVKVA